MSDKPKGAVYQAFRSAYRSHQYNLSRDLERQGEVSAQLAGYNADIVNTRQAIAELDAFAHDMGWAPKDYSK